MNVILAPEDGYLANKTLTIKKWMNGKCYFKRINKKWLKRYGKYWNEPCKKGTVLYSEVSDLIMCRPEDFELISEAFKDIRGNGNEINIGNWDLKIEKPKKTSFEPRFYGYPILRSHESFRITG